MTEEEKRRRSSEPRCSAKYAFAKDAAANGCLVYSPETDKYYTPKEFMDCNEEVTVFRNKHDHTQFRIKEPQAGLKHRLEQFKNAERELSEFITKLAEVYNFTPKTKR